MLKTMRIGAYGILTDQSGRTLMRVSTPDSNLPGSWWLPGGEVEHGEDPADAVVREFAEQTGLDVKITRTRTPCAAVVDLSDDHSEHNTLFVYDVEVVAGELVGDFEGGHARDEWVRLSEITGKPMSPITATMLGLDPAPLVVTGQRPRREPEPGTGQRVGVYAWVTDPDGRVLMTLIPEGFWGAGNWHLPGGGLDFGEQPVEALLREIEEETSQEVTLTGLRTVESRHDADSVDPDGTVVDFHALHIIFDATVEQPKPLQIKDIGGSTGEVRWFHPDEVARLAVTPPVDAVLGRG